MRVLLGVTGGMAAYKVAMVVRLLKEAGHSVKVLPTDASLNFVGRSTWEALSGESACNDTFADVPSVSHIRLGQRADIVLVAPATADFIASYTHGQARDLLGNALLATTAPVVIAPAMHTEMWQHPATVANVETLRARGVHVLPPAVGRLTGPDSGPGRLPEPQEIVDFVLAVARGEGLEALPETRETQARPWGDLNGVRIAISAGGTREAIDAVRFIGNRSSGHQGFALAEAARERGAHVTVVAANVTLPLGEGITRVDVENTAGLAAEIREASADSDIVIMAAAVADFRPAEPVGHKIKKSHDGHTVLELVHTEDILKELVGVRRQGQTIVGFAAETGDGDASALEYAKAKAKRKGADLLVFNPVGLNQGFGDVPNSVTMLDANGEVVARAHGDKLTVAHAILDAIVARRESDSAL